MLFGKFRLALPQTVLFDQFDALDEARLCLFFVARRLVFGRFVFRRFGFRRVVFDGGLFRRLGFRRFLDRLDLVRLDDAFERAMERYTAGEYDPAARALSTWLEAHPEHGPARFYLAAAREQLGQPSEAEADYRRVAEEQEGSLGEHARWRLANLLLARGEVQRARSELERLTSSTAGFAAQARELLERLPR